MTQQFHPRYIRKLKTYSYKMLYKNVIYIICNSKKVATTQRSCSCMCVLSHYSHVWLFATLWTKACQLLCLWDSPGKSTGVVARPSPRGSSQPGIKCKSAAFLALHVDSWPTEPPGILASWHGHVHKHLVNTSELNERNTYKLFIWLGCIAVFVESISRCVTDLW